MQVISFSRPFPLVLMEHPPKQGLKRYEEILGYNWRRGVLMEHPPKQGLKQDSLNFLCVTGKVLMEHPPKQGLKLLKVTDGGLMSLGF